MPPDFFIALNRNPFNVLRRDPLKEEKKICFFPVPCLSISQGMDPSLRQRSVTARPLPPGRAANPLQAATVNGGGPASHPPIHPASPQVLRLACCLL